MSRLILANRRVMFVPAAANTYYPTGVITGIGRQDGTFFSQANTASTSAAASVFVMGATPDQTTQFVIRSIQAVTRAVAGAATCQIQAHATTGLLIPTLTAVAAVGFLLSDAPLELDVVSQGGFKVVQAGADNALLKIVYEYELR